MNDERKYAVQLEGPDGKLYGDKIGPVSMTKRELALRKALAAFEPMVPPHTMTELTNVIEKHLEDVRKFEEKNEKR